ncbi:hypothetical protein N825_06025 [Skermanella stibiiresistens SB22]|jgi:hypothetical protein|uniref:Uncharacterized protein n=1 Tax=Skermanella stibiiresistens SB22 TaxID=1385369 RepID=W9H4G8_9PROT|nr:hypothetical protein [Skermanella stibiiresistens]EWY39686.1 hypothetical protein N825_06025 [Skermanella stibiiresistens SB22]
MRPRNGLMVMTEDDRRRLLDRLERLGEQKVRLMSGVDCVRFFGNWQAAELVEEWLEFKSVERQEQTGLLGRLFGRR